MFQIPPSDWNFNNSITEYDTELYGAINEYNKWELVDNSRTFNNPICEIPIKLNNVNLTVSINR